MNYRQAVLGIYINEEKKFLIGPSPRDGGYKFPQGGKDKGESSYQTLLREALEETGCDISSYQIINAHVKVNYNFSKQAKQRFLEEKFIGQEMEVFYILIDSHHFNPIPQDNEFEKFIWISKKDFDNYDFKHRKKAYKTAIEHCSYL